MGIGQAQLWNPTAIPKQPALAVAAYSALMLALSKSSEPNAALFMHNYRDGAAMQGGLPALTSLHCSEKRHANIPIFSPNSRFGQIQLILSPPQPLENVETPDQGRSP